jgi:hypothetical protein
MAALRGDTDDALARVAALEADVEALRAEVARLTVVLGTQIAGVQDAVERLEQARADERPSA